MALKDRIERLIFPPVRVDLARVVDDFGRPPQREQNQESVPKDAPLILGGLQNSRHRGFVSDLSTESVAMALSKAEEGDLGAQMALFQQMEERDPAVAAAMMTRRSAPVGLERVVLPAPRGRDQKRALDVQRYTEGVLEGIPDLDTVLLDMFDAVGKSISALETDWRRDGTVMGIRHIDPVQYEFNTYNPDNPLARRGDFVITDYSDPILPRKVYPKDHPWKFIIHHARMRSGHPARGGVLRTIAWAYVFRNYALKDISVFCEIYGMPFRVAKYKRNASKDDKAILADMVKKMASDAWAVISEDASIEFLESVNRGQEPYTAFLNILRSEIFLAVLGQEGTNVVTKFGTKGDSEVKQTVRQDILEADCKQAQNTLRSQLLYPIVLFKYGRDVADEYTPTLKFRYEPPINRTIEAEVDVKTLKELGLGRHVRIKDVAAKYGWEILGDGEEALLKEDEIGDGAQPRGDDSKRQSDNQKRDKKDPKKASLMAMHQLLRAKASSPVEAHQFVVDELHEAMESGRLSATEQITKTLMASVIEAQSFEDLLLRLSSIYDTLDSSEMEIFLAQSMFIVDLYGRAAVNAE